MAKLLGIDVGTSGAKALLVDDAGKVLRSASAEYPLLTPRPLWSEQDPDDWWSGVLRCVAEIGEPRPDAVGVTGQMHGAVFLDGAGQVIRPAILWNDQRTAAECEEIEAAVGQAHFREITRNPPLTGFQAPKVLWLRRHEPENYARVRAILLPKDFARFRLSGSMGSDVSDASGTGLFDVAERKWSEELMGALDLKPEWFAPVWESWQVCASTQGVPGLNDGVPIVAGAGDQAAGAVGTGAVERGIMSVSLGTSGVVFTALDAPEYDLTGAAHTFCHANGAWHAMGVMLSCGGSLRWYRDTLGAGRSYEAIAESAAAAPPGCDGLCFLPYLAGERAPHNDPRARAGFVGATLSHGRTHFDRAVFEGVSFGIKDCMDLLLRLGAEAREVRITGGGARSAFWLQMLADLFQATCHTLEADEGPAFGAALLAGVGAGVWPDVRTACRAVVRTRLAIVPGSTDYEEALRRYRALFGFVRDWFSNL